MRPASLKTKIFLDGGDPKETLEAIHLLGFLDGQTTNPTLVSKNPEVQERFSRGEKFSKLEIFEFYHKIVWEISKLLPTGSVSVEVYADKKTTADEMLAQGKEMFSWIPNAHIKYPTTQNGLAAAAVSINQGMRVNMTLVFSQDQAAAVYAATLGANKGQVFVSPFVGRLDDIGENGMSAVENILKMYKLGNGHVEVLTASIRNIYHFMYALKLGSDIISAPAKILKEWVELGMPIPDENYTYNPTDLAQIPFKELNLGKDWKSFNIQHDLTDKGIERFANDWNSLIKR